VAAVRAFNRFYTRQIGVLGDHLLGSPYSLTEMRVLYELASRTTTTATALGRDLGLDAGYLSRILARFARRNLITRAAAPHDARQTMLRLTARGRAAFKPLDARARQGIAAWLDPLPPAAQREVVDAMATIERRLANADAQPACTLRTHRAGDMGWVVHRHGVLYAREWGYDSSFEALVARIVADFLDRFDAERERCWIAERAGEIVGSVFLVKQTKTTAKLRLLLVEPSARGLGLGRRLVDECIGFARSAGYRRITLWTQGELVAARAIYRNAGFVLVDSKPGHNFGKETVAETWELSW
jgi:DNA-binding MarR family transcriptional regulator/N-acetylglutamate synthase-like GNAT family acetyltransferase